MKTPMLQSFRLENFKAVRDSRTVKFTPLTVFIGNNGSGKSSLIEGLETLRSIVTDGLDQAMLLWRGIEHIRYQGRENQLRTSKEGRLYYNNPIRFYIKGKTRKPKGSRSAPLQSFTAKMEVSVGPGGNELFIYREKVSFRKGWKYERFADGRIQPQQPNPVLRPSKEPVNTGDNLTARIALDEHGYMHFPHSDDESLINSLTLSHFIQEWQFISLVPMTMGAPTPQRRADGTIQLAKDGSNIAQYLLDIRKKDATAFDGILETLQSVLPYARDLQPSLTFELERTVYLQLTEGDFKLPGWLLSTGTLRVLCLLALLRHPEPSPLIVIEEVENGLDPRTVNLIVEEIRNVIETGKTQIILTTHSPYLLDLLSLSQIVLVERVDGQPTFTRPANRQSLQEWAKEFAPGQLYTMDLLSGKGD